MMIRLLDEGYQVAALKVLGNVTPRFFKHTKILLEDTAYVRLQLWRGVVSLSGRGL